MQRTYRSAQHTAATRLREVTRACNNVPMPISIPLITVTKASKQTGISKRTIQDAIARGDLPALKTGDQTAAYLIDPDDLQWWLTSRKAEAS